MLATPPELDAVEIASLRLTLALEDATDAPLPDGAQCSNCKHFIDYSGDGYTRVINPDGTLEYTNDQVGVCLKQMATAGYKATCPDCHHHRQRKLPCAAHRSTRRSYNQCPGWEPNLAWLFEAGTEF